MSVALELSRLSEARNTIRTKMVNLGVAVGTDKLDELATKISNIENRGAVEIEVKEGETYTIPAGYHNGSGTVSGVAGGGNYTLQAKTVTPTKAEQDITPDEGKYGLSSVTVEAIPDNYQDISSTTAEAGDVKTGKVFVGADGTTVAGTMPVITASAETIGVGGSYTIPAGYHDGTGTVTGPTLTGNAVAANVLAEKTFYSNSGTQIEGTMPNNGKVTETVAVGGTYTIPEGYHNGEGTVAGPVLDGNAETAHVLVDKTFFSNNGTKKTGTMVDNAAVTATIDGLTTSSYTIPAGYHNGSGTVSLTSDIEDALAAI